MKIVTTTAVFPPCWDHDNIIERLSAIGYDDLDMAFDYLADDKNFPFMTDRYEEWAYAVREKAAKHGMTYTHSHAGFDVTASPERAERTYRCASVLGCRYLVAHPVFRTADYEIEDDDEFIRINAEIIKPQLELAEKYGVIILSENLLWGASTRTQTIAELVREVNSPYFGWCYDCGHAHTTGDSLENFRRVCRAPLSLHIHDNNGDGRDDHAGPGYGTLDWGDYLRALHDVGYKGEFVLEAHHQPLDAPDEDRDGIMKDYFDRAVKMRDYFLSL